MSNAMSECKHFFSSLPYGLLLVASLSDQLVNQLLFLLELSWEDLPAVPLIVEVNCAAWLCFNIATTGIVVAEAKFILDKLGNVITGKSNNFDLAFRMNMWVNLCRGWTDNIDDFWAL